MKDTKRIYLNIKVHPRSRKQDVFRIDADTYKVHVVAPPSKGEANKELVKVMAAHFGLPVSCVHIVRGLTSRNKVVALEPGSQTKR